MAFGMSPFPLQFGSRGGGGDPTVLTDAILAALGFTYTRTGEVYGRRAPGGPGNYVRHATNDPEFDFTEVDGKNYPSLIVRGAATPLISYSADLTNAAWTKTNCTAALALGGLEHDADWRGGQVVQNSEFSADSDFIKGTGWSIPDGTAVASGVTNSDVLQQNDCFTVGKYYLCEFDVDATIGDFYAFLGTNGNFSAYVELVVGVNSVIVRAIGTHLYIRTGHAGSSNGITINYFRATEVDAHSLVTATGNNATVTRQLTRASANRNTRWKIKAPSTNSGDVKVSQDNGSTSITLTPGEFADIELGEQTSANPTIWLQLTDDGDTVEHYDVQMAELAAATPVPNFVPQGATPAAVGNSSLSKTNSVEIEEVDISILAEINGDSVFFRSHVPDYYDASVYVVSDTNLVVLNVRPDSEGFAQSFVDLGAVTPGEIGLVDVEHNATAFRARKNKGTWIPATRYNITGGTVVHIGTEWNGTGSMPFPMVAFRDNNGQLLGTPGTGFNIGAIERYEASL